MVVYMKNKKLLKLYIRECVKREINESKTTPETFGDLKKILNAIVLSQGNKEKAKKELSKAGFEILVDLIPYGSTAKSVGGLIKSLVKMKDESRPDNFLGDLDIDDQVSLIVDNELEEKFVVYVSNKINQKPDDERLKGFNMTSELNNFLKKNFKGRHFKVR